MRQPTTSNTQVLQYSADDGGGSNLCLEAYGGSSLVWGRQGEISHSPPSACRPLVVVSTEGGGGGAMLVIVCVG